MVPARPFLRRLIDAIHTVRKPYHFIRLSQSIRADMHTWLQFLQSYNGVTFFRFNSIISSFTINMASDASKTAFGACYGSKWIQCPYPTSWQSRNITILELYPVYVMLNMFGHLLTNSNILFHSDNMAVTAILNSQSSKEKTIMSILRPLILILVKYNINLRSQHIPGLLNILPDRISRFQVTSELLHQHKMDPEPTSIPLHLRPENFVPG